MSRGYRRSITASCGPEPRSPSPRVVELAAVGRYLREHSRGEITGGTCFVMSHGMEDWHPNPDFFFQSGAGPIHDPAILRRR